MGNEIPEGEKKKAEGTTKEDKEITETAKNAVMPAVEKGNEEFSYPKIETESTFLKEQSWFVCSRCNSKLGPVSTHNWRKNVQILATEARAAFGTVTANPLLIAKGNVDVIREKRNEEMFVKEFKQDKQDGSRGKGLLLQCEHCGEWYCSTCWDMEKNVCSRCSAKGMKSMLGL